MDNLFKLTHFGVVKEEKGERSKPEQISGVVMGFEYIPDDLAMVGGYKLILEDRYDKTILEMEEDNLAFMLIDRLLACNLNETIWIHTTGTFMDVRVIVSQKDDNGKIIRVQPLYGSGKKKHDQYPGVSKGTMAMLSDFFFNIGRHELCNEIERKS